MQSWYQDLLEDRLTHCGHSLDPVFRLTADRSNPFVALKRSTRIVDRLGDRTDHEDLTAAHAFHGCRRAGSDCTDISNQALSFAEQNMKATFDHARKLVQATDLQQAMQIQSEFLKSQFTNAALQMRQITSEIMSCAIDASKDKFQGRPPATIR